MLRAARSSWIVLIGEWGMPQFVAPPEFLAAVAEHRRRRRRRTRVLTAAALVAALGAAAAVVVTRHGGDDATAVPAALAAARCSTPATPLVVAASADKAALMTRFGEEFSRSGKDGAGRCVQVTVVPKSSGAAATALAAGWPERDGERPDVWSPTGSIWLPLLEDRLVKAQRSSLIPTPDDVPHLASSPMVVAMPRPMATALGWPEKPIGWADLLTLASSRKGWGAYGHPEWGRFSLGKTNPNFSHAGLEGTVATYYAAVGRMSGLRSKDISAATTRRFVAGVEQSVVRYGDTTASFQSDWLRADDKGKALQYISALVTEENLVPSYNEGNPTGDPALAGKHPAPQVPLVAVYPKEGTFVADHPYALLSAPWVTPAKRQAADAFLAYLLSPGVQKQWQDNHFRDAAGRPGDDGLAQGVIPDQPRRVLTPPSPRITGEILDSWAELRKTANVISLVDVSGSMAEPVPGSSKTRLDAAVEASEASLGLFTDHDEVGLWTFSGGVRGVQDSEELVPVGPMDGAVGDQVRRKAIAAALRDLRPNGDTGLYNSVAAAYQSVLDRYRDDRINAVVVLTDGRNDADGGLQLPGLLKLIKSISGGREIRVITIAYGPDADAESLAEIARATKGASYVAATPADIPKIYSAALSNL
ncbi:substrate-binding and VWA domain-containing protein [Kineosporia sp. A_224]|uniref:substrate-binding and VWA domain-containing protein n=1 Tax=Kineosporia sp. A_224 TaxID=1962180 RepID=UPI000B4B4F54|nr:substrate-binding and VWA domain-containing protein [Kineosporia sp. A_224]